MIDEFRLLMCLLGAPFKHTSKIKNQKSAISSDKPQSVGRTTQALAPRSTSKIQNSKSLPPSFVGKVAGLVSALDVIPFVDPTIGVVVFAAASILKDAVNRIGDLLDDGKPNK
jgi:hypothetical protein